MQGRPHKDRLLYDLNEVRKELAQVVQRIPSNEFDWAPGEGMKTCRALLLEIGTMERICTRWLTQQEMGDWKEVQDATEWGDNEPASALRALDQVRAETLAYLSAATEERLQTPIPLPESWYQYFNSPVIEPEELLRWIVRHEYYHLGQLIIYRWTQGDNPLHWS
jgi:uncharacterized damage-inducible protein DinB